MKLWHGFVRYTNILVAKLFIRLVVGIIGGRGGDHIRKVYFVQSLHKHIMETLSVGPACTVDICQLAEVCTDAQVLSIPTRLYALLWEGEPVSDVIRQVRGLDNLESVAARIVDVAPWWLQYGRDSDMAEDVKKVFFAMGVGSQVRFAI